MSRAEDVDDATAYHAGRDPDANTLLLLHSRFLMLLLPPLPRCIASPSPLVLFLISVQSSFLASTLLHDLDLAPFIILWKAGLRDVLLILVVQHPEVVSDCLLGICRRADVLLPPLLRVLWWSVRSVESPLQGWSTWRAL